MATHAENNRIRISSNLASALIVIPIAHTGAICVKRKLLSVIRLENSATAETISVSVLSAVVIVKVRSKISLEIVFTSA